MAVFDKHPNNAVSTVAVAPSPATTGTSLGVATGDGVAMFSECPFQASVWPSGVAPSRSNREIVSVTGQATDTLTIVRAQEGTSARTIVVGDQIAVVPTRKTWEDVEGRLLPTMSVPTGNLGSFTVADGEYRLIGGRCILSGTDRIIVQGTGRLRHID